MRLKKIALGLIVVSLMVLMIPTVFACEPPPEEPGYSPGYWKHEVRAHYLDRGAKHYSPAEFGIIFANTGFPSLGWAYERLWNNEFKSIWLDIANAFNAAAGLGPYNG